jgi:hypothetical protein
MCMGIHSRIGEAPSLEVSFWALIDICLRRTEVYPMPTQMLTVGCIPITKIAIHFTVRTPPPPLLQCWHRMIAESAPFFNFPSHLSVLHTTTGQWITFAYSETCNTTGGLLLRHIVELLQISHNSIFRHSCNLSFGTEFFNCESYYAAGHLEIFCCPVSVTFINVTRSIYSIN